MQSALDGLLALRLSDDTWGSAALVLVLHGTSLVERYEDSGVLAELEEGINAITIANRFIPENKPGCLNNLLPSSV
jgi:hypothetical protein